MRLNLIIGVLISALSVYYLTTKIDAPQLIDAFRGVNLLPVIPAVLLNLSSIWVRAVRWKYLLKPVGKVRVESLFCATLVGFMVNMLLPGRLGELLRAHVVGERDGVSKLGSFATIVVERLIDCFCVVAILLGVIIVFLLGRASEIGDLLPHMKYYGIVATGILVGFLILFILLQKRRSWALKFFSPLLLILPKRLSRRYEDMVNAFLDGFQSLNKGSNLALVIILSIPLWSIGVVVNYLLIGAFGIKLPLYGYFFLIIAQTLGVLIPTPGFIGTYHLATRTGLVLLGVQEAKAQSLAIVTHASFFIPLVVAGLIYWWAGGLSLKAITKQDSIELNP